MGKNLIERGFAQIEMRGNQCYPRSIQSFLVLVGIIPFFIFIHPQDTNPATTGAGPLAIYQTSLKLF